MVRESGNKGLMAKSLLVVATEYDPFPGGIGRYGSELAAAARNLGWKVAVVAPSHGTDIADDEETSRYRTGRQFRPADSLRLWLAVRRNLRADRPETIHATDYRAFVIARLAMGLRPVEQLIVTCHGTELKNAHGLRRVIQRLTLRRPRLVANSRYTASLVRARLGRAADAVTPLGVDMARFSGPSDHAVADDDALLVLCVGRFEERKAQDVLVRAAGLVSDGGLTKVRYVFVGDDSTEFGQRVKAQARRSRARCEVLGTVAETDLRDLYQRADIFCLPGRPHPHRAEGFGLVYLEAAAAHLPSIASRIDAIPEVVQDGVTGILVEPDDPVRLAWALTRLLTDAALRGAMGDAARSAAQAYTWESTARLTYIEASG